MNNRKMFRMALAANPVGMPIAMLMGGGGKKKAVSRVPRAMGRIAQNGQRMT